MGKTACVLMLVGCCVLPSAAALQAGVSTVDITPPIGGRMAGYGARGMAVSTGVHDPLLAKALVLKDVDTSLALVTLDLAGVPTESVETIRQSIRERTGVEQVMLLPSHTHSGPDQNRRFPSAEQSWVAELEEKLLNAVVSANDSLAPVRYGVGKGKAVEGHNRRKVNEDGTCEMLWRNPERVPTEPVDYTVGVIRFEHEDGTLLATLVNFTCHPVVLGPENLEISADYPGVLTKTVEEALGGTCLFANGACGDINPFMDKTAPADGAFEEVAKMGTALAQEVIRVSQAMTMHDTVDVPLTAETESIPMEMRWDYDNPDVVAAFQEKYGKTLVNLFLKRMKDNLAEALVGDLVTVTLGDDVAIVGLPGEFFVAHGLDLKQRCVIPNTFVFGYCNRSFAYFPTINAAWQGGYGAKEATFVAVGTGEHFIDKALINLYYQTDRLSRVPKL